MMFGWFRCKPKFDKSDLESAVARIRENNRPGAFIELNEREWSAIMTTQWADTGRMEDLPK